MKKIFLIGVCCSVVLGAQAQPRQCLLLTAATPSAGDPAVSDRLVALGFVVTRVTDTASVSADANGKDLIFISSSVGSGNIGTKFTASPVPMIIGENALYDELGIDANNAGGATLPGQTQINIVDCTHPLAAGLPGGLLTVLSAPGPIVELSGIGIPVASAQIVARSTDGSASVFGIEAGAPLNPARIASAPARRVGFFLEATTFMTEAGLKLFDAAVAWATGTPVNPSTPIGLSLQPTNTTVNENMAANFRVGFTGAGPYFVQWQRDDGMGSFTNIPGATCGPYTLAPTTPPDSGARFSAVVSNNFSSATSAIATLTVITDTNPPIMLAAYAAGLAPESFDLIYSEPVEPNAAVDAFNYSLGNGTGVLTVTLDADGKTVHFTCGPITNGTILSLSGGSVTDRAFMPNVLNPGDPGSSIAIVASDGALRRHRYNNINGVLISDLTNNAKFPSRPDVVDFPTTLEDPSPDESFFGVHLLGYLTAPVSGKYNFFISADDQGLFYLSTDDSPAHLHLIAAEPQWNNPREWVAPNSLDRRLARTAGVSNFFPNADPNKPQNRSEFMVGPITLVQGQRYYFEAFMKEHDGGNNLGVTWQKPGEPTPTNNAPPIPALYLSRYDVPVSIPANQPADVTGLEARQTSFSVAPGGSPLMNVQWYESGQPIPGAVGFSYTTPLLSTNDSGKMYFAVVNNSFSSATSRVALLTVNIDTNGPVLVSASSVHSMDIGVCFDETIDPTTAGNAANYSVNGGAVAVSSATVRYDGRTVQLALGAPISGPFTVQANNVLDVTGRNTIAPASTASGLAGGLTPFDLGGAGDPIAPGSTFSCRLGEFEIIAGGTDIWNMADHGHLAYETIADNFDKRVLIARIDNTDGSAKGGFMVRETTSADSRNLHAIVMPGSPARNIYETGTRMVTAGATVGWGVLGGVYGNLAATHPNSWVRLRRVGNTFSAFVSTNGVDWTKNGESVQSYQPAVLFGLAATSHNNDGRTNRVLFQNFSDTAYTNAAVAITQQPVNTTIDANHSVTFSVAASVSGAPASELIFQWQRDNGAGGFTNLIGANSSNHTFLAALTDNNAQFRAVAFVPGASATSVPATLVVSNDMTLPLLLSATRGRLTPNTVVVAYSELLETNSAVDPFNYALADTSGNASVFSAVTLRPNGQSVFLDLVAPLVDRTDYVLTVNAVADLAGNPVAANSQVLVGFSGRRATGPQNLVVIEAENYDGKLAQGGKDWLFFSNPVGNGTFSGPGYMQALPESGAAINEPAHVTQSPRLDYFVNFPVNGTWYVWLRGNDVTVNANSVHVGVDNTDSPDLNDNRIGNTGGATGWGNPAGPSSPWQWTRDPEVNTRVAFVTVPSAGLHTFNIWMREDSVLVDKLLLTTSSGFVLSPNTILGPAESPSEPPPVTLAISRSAGVVTVSWTRGPGTLQHAADVTGTWTNVIGAANPYSVNATEAKGFFRVRVQ